MSPGILKDIVWTFGVFTALCAISISKEPGMPTFAAVRTNFVKCSHDLLDWSVRL